MKLFNGRASEDRRDPFGTGEFTLEEEACDWRTLDPGGVKSPDKKVLALPDLDGVSEVEFSLVLLRQLPHAAAAARGRARGDAVISEMEGRDGKL